MIWPAACSAAFHSYRRDDRNDRDSVLHSVRRLDWGLPMTLQLAISGIPGTAAEIRTALQQTVEISRNAVPYTWAGVNAAMLSAGIDPQVIDAVVTGLPQMAGGAGLNASLSSGGVDFTLQTIRDAVAASSLPDGVKTVLLAIGVQHGPKWQQLGLESLPTEQAIQDALDAIANRQAKAALMNEIIAPLVADESKTVADIKTAVAEA